MIFITREDGRFDRAISSYNKNRVVLVRKIEDEDYSDFLDAEESLPYLSRICRRKVKDITVLTKRGEKQTIFKNKFIPAKNTSSLSNVYELSDPLMRYHKMMSMIWRTNEY